MESAKTFDIREKLRKIEETMATKKELNEVIETMAVLSNSDTMRQIAQSERDIENGDVKVISSVDELWNGV